MFALYVALYGFGRFFTEGIRLDFSYDTFGPIRFNQFVAALICLAGVAILVWLVKFKPGREESVYLPGREAPLDETDEPETGDAELDADSSAEPDDVPPAEVETDDQKAPADTD